MGKRSVREHTKHEFNTEFEKLLSDQEHGRLKKSDIIVRPAYAYTSICPDKSLREGITPGRYKAGES